jgi:hypothetical protein
MRMRTLFGHYFVTALRNLATHKLYSFINIAGLSVGLACAIFILVISQFAVSIGLGIAALVVFSQITFARHIDLGFERDGVVIIRGITKLAPSARESFARAFSDHPQIAGAVLSDGAPFDLSNVSNVAIQIQGEPQSFAAHLVSISPDFPSLYGALTIAWVTIIAHAIRIARASPIIALRYE